MESLNNRGNEKVIVFEKRQATDSLNQSNVKQYFARRRVFRFADINAQKIIQY